MSLSGHVAFVTGASQGIGRACALRLAKEGATVAVAARNQEKLNELVQQVAAAGGQAAAFPLDVADEEQIKLVFKAAIAQFGRVGFHEIADGKWPIGDAQWGTWSYLRDPNSALIVEVLSQISRR